MDDGEIPTDPFVFSQENVDELKRKYSTELKDDPDNPIKVCMKLVFEAAIERDPERRTKLALELSQYLTRSDGVINLFLALVDFDTSSQRVTTHNQRFIAVAKIITLLPKLCLPYHDYCANISQQLKPLLIHPKPLYSSLAAIIIKALLESAHAEKAMAVSGGRSVADVVLGPLLAQFTGTNQDGKFKLYHSIVAVHNLIQNHLPVRLFAGHFSNLFFCLYALNSTPSGLKVYLRQCLVEILDNLAPGPACCLLEKTIFFDSLTSNTYAILTEDDEISVELTEHTDPTPEFVDELVNELLENCDNHSLVMEYFFHFQAKMWTSCDRKTAERCASLIEPLLCQTVEEKPEENKLDISASLMADSTKAWELIDKTLMHYLNFLRANQDSDQGTADEAQNLAESSLSNCLNILQVLCSTSGTPTARTTELEMMQGKTLPNLREIKNILVYRTYHRKQSNSKLLQSLDSLIEELAKDRAREQGSQEDETKISQREHQSILKDLNDKLVPVRVHALVRLRQMLMANDKYTICMIPNLYPVVECSLADQEPYVFLASINLLVEMALRQTCDILPRLITLHSCSDLDVQQRINVGEALVRLTRQMNATTPHYAGQVMDALLKSANSDPEELVRMSSLTNIGFICNQLGNSLGKYILDILASVQAVLESDAIQLKCAAIDLLRTTLMGLDRRNVESVQRDLGSIYALLKRLAQISLDEKLCLHVDLALQEIGRLAKDIIGVSGERERSDERLVKNIKVLSLD